MVEPGDVPKVVSDAARLVRRGELVLFGSAALAYWMKDPPPSRDIDLWCVPPEGGDVLEAVMGELSWYHEKHGAYVEVWGPETFPAPEDWRDRARRLQIEGLDDLEIVVPHPHDILLGKLERMDEKDRTQARGILLEYPLSAQALSHLIARMPHRTGGITEPDRIARFEAGLRALETLLR